MAGIRGAGQYRRWYGLDFVVVDIVSDPIPSPVGDEWSLLRLPYVFSQDGLLGSDDFIEQAKERDITVSLEQLAQLHEVGLLNPLYLVIDDIDETRRIVDAGLYAAPANPRGRTFTAARDGRLR